MGCIYYHKNKINGHMYIGQSIFNSDYIKYGRWGAHGQGYKSNKYFWNAIQKYTWENFEHGFFEDNISKELLNEKEIYYIAKYHTYKQDPEYNGGYNLTPGGEGSMNTWWPEEDAWLCDNYSLDKTRSQIVEEYRKTFPDSYHSDVAIKARLKTLRLSTIDNVHFWSDNEVALLIELWPSASKAAICAALPNRAYEAIRSKAKLLKLDKRNSFIETTVSYVQNNKQVNHKVYLPYTEAEDRLIIANFPTHGTRYCIDLLAKELGSIRTYNSVKDRANKVLKLHCSEKFTAKSGFDLKSFEDLYYLGGLEACMKKFNLSKQQVYNIANRNNFKISSITNKIAHHAKKVYCIELDKYFLGYREAAKYLNKKTISGIQACCCGKRQTAYGYHWKLIN